MTSPHRATRRGAWRLLSDAWYRLLCFLLVVALAALIIPVSLQIFSRHTELIPAYIWTEEMARLMFVWVIMIGAMVGMRDRLHFTVDIWPTLSPRGNAWLELGSGLFTLAFALVFVWAGWEFAIYRISELAELPLWTIHVAWPVLGVTWVMFHGEHMVRMARLAFGIDPAPSPEQHARPSASEQGA
jgi:TRAP-type C4-dicarboxylate transport system permease small subunit